MNIPPSPTRLKPKWNFEFTVVLVPQLPEYPSGCDAPRLEEGREDVTLTAERSDRY